MKTLIPGCFFALLAAGLSVQAADPKESIASAAKALGETSGYSWTTTTEVPEGTRFRPGPIEGRTLKDGTTHVTMSFAGNQIHVALKGGKAAITNQDGEWDSVSELENSEGRGRFRAMMARNVSMPAKEAVELLKHVEDLKESDGAIAGNLTAEGAKSLMRFGRGGGGPEISGAKGTIQFWTKDGVLSQYRYHVAGSMDWNGNTVDIDRTVTVGIKDVESTAVNLPEEALAKL